jgi:hypothetical protein
MQTPVLVTVVEFGPNSIADDHSQIIVECHVTGIEYAMDVSPQEYAIRNFVLAAIAVSANVCGI